ncbi:hypothetical protein C2845_PM18G05510 [Panicum miliaceum]|uniref:Uncharacterized protein n=1 Tax=Panicum miliaceum TaxID=4540 RepID=A0A3L6PJH2_PANMI|nr:hypothetical protein C2845_PM18G05510 [Panicum miliaceum]
MPRANTAGRGGNKRKAHDEKGDQAPPTKVGKSEAGGEDTSRPSKVEDLPVVDLVDIPELVKRIRALKAKGVSRVSVAYFFERRIQPL